MHAESKKHVLFDIDGTLLDSETVVLESLLAATNKHGLPPIDPSCTRRYFGVPGVIFLRTIGIPDPDGVFLDWRLELNRRSGKIKPYDGIVELLGNLKACGVPAGVVTSRTLDVASADLNSLNLMPFFDELITAEDTQANKPLPDPILLYLRKKQLSPKHCIYIGDTISDCQCAHAAGVQFLLAGWGTSQQSEMSQETIVSRPADVLEYL